MLCLYAAGLSQNGKIFSFLSLSLRGASRFANFPIGFPAIQLVKDVGNEDIAGGDERAGNFLLVIDGEEKLS